MVAKEDKKKKTDKEKEDEGVAGGILKGIGKMIPGLGGLIESLGKSPAFKERLKKVDQELERKLKESPLKRTEEGRPSHIPMGIPPGARGKVARRRGFVSARGGSAYGGKERPAAMPEGPPPVPRERPVDIFDEKDYVKIIAEMPGIEESDIKIDLVKDNLAISVDTPERKYHQKLKLPCEPKGKLEKTYKNGILEIKINKG